MSLVEALKRVLDNAITISEENGILEVMNYLIAVGAVEMFNLCVGSLTAEEKERAKDSIISYTERCDVSIVDDDVDPELLFSNFAKTLTALGYTPDDLPKEEKGAIDLLKTRMHVVVR